MHIISEKNLKPKELRTNRFLWISYITTIGVALGILAQLNKAFASPMLL